MSTATPRELELKAKILMHLRSEGIISRDTVLASEYSVAPLNLRADLAILGSSFIGVEVKSEFDSLRRLHRQLASYRRVFDKVILVIAERHLPSITEEELYGVEVWKAQGPTLTCIQKPIDISESADRVRLPHLMTKKERKKFGLDDLELTAVSEMEERAAFTNAFKARFFDTSVNFWNKVKKSKISSTDLHLLSRFRERRILDARADTQRREQGAKLAEGWKNAQSLQSSSVSTAPDGSP